MFEKTAQAQKRHWSTWFIFALAGAVVVILGFFIVQLFLSGTLVSVEEKVETDGGTSGESQATSNSELESNLKMYRNDEWRFSFKYPSGWKIEDPASYSKVAMLNLAVWPETEDVFYPVRVVITPKWWIDRILDDPDQVKQPVTIDGVTGWSYDSITMSVIPTTEYLLLINDEYWINLSIQQEFADQLSMILDTFKLHRPLPTLAELGIEPYLPEW